MRGYTLRESGRFALAVLGALLMAVAISVLPHAHSAARPGILALALVHKLGAYLQLDFGDSVISGLGAGHELAARGPTTLTLVLFGGAIAFAVGVPVGLIFGGGPLRRATAPLIQIAAAAPVFCAGLALAYVAQNIFHLPVNVGGADVLRALFLPALTVGLAGAASVQLALRRAAAECQGLPFRAGLRGLGLSQGEIDRTYVMPLVLGGLFESLGEVMLSLLSAAVVAEWVFDCKGVADLFVQSVALGDWNIAALILFVFALAVLLADFAGKLLARALTGGEPGR